MRVQDFIAESTNQAMEGFIRQLQALPVDKVDWKPMEEGRSALNQAQELAVIGAYYPTLLTEFKPPVFDEALMADYKKQCDALDTLDKAIAALRTATASACEAIKAVPDEKLEQEMQFFGPAPWKIHQVMNAHLWNLHYHTGQVCYIQTLAGDKEMH